ncbi:thyrotroph embryonic factor-like isoform X1 [Liolophura sinensis]|uniref:thyrotroph embryonic factor-like isoform X1 n=1 Tax=Liolophura sinensis TaxID=3198878 RepID=UPI0031581F11
MSTFGFHSGMTLKALLENPNLQNPLLSFNDSEKKDGKESPRIDMGSAFLGPNLWEKTYDMDDFKLEYMDLDEFLSENGLPIATDDASNHSQRSSGSNSSLGRGQQGLRLEMPSPSQGPPPEAPTTPPARCSPPSSPALQPSSEQDAGSSPVEDKLGVSIDFEVGPQDLALVTIPGEAEFDPRKHKFTDDDLKPQPMIKKSKKVFVPDSAKDDRYWCRRKKNNVAAKRSRDARRIKENQIAMRASYLERENTSIKEEVEKLRRENIRLKAALSKYEKQS